MRERESFAGLRDSTVAGHRRLGRKRPWSFAPGLLQDKILTTITTVSTNITISTITTDTSNTIISTITTITITTTAISTHLESCSKSCSQDQDLCGEQLLFNPAPPESMSWQDAPIP